MIKQRVSECHVSLALDDGYMPAIVGEPGDEAFLGLITLEILGLVLNPFNRTLQQMQIDLA